MSVAPPCESCGFQDDTKKFTRTCRMRLDGVVLCARCFDPDKPYKRWEVWNYVKRNWEPVHV